MKKVIGLCLLVLGACGEPPQRQVRAAGPENPADFFRSDDLVVVGAKCAAILSLPEYQSAENATLRSRWEQWIAPQISAATMDKMVRLNAQALSTTPAPAIAAALPVCREKIEVVAPRR